MKRTLLISVAIVLSGCRDSAYNVQTDYNRNMLKYAIISACLNGTLKTLKHPQIRKADNTDSDKLATELVQYCNAVGEEDANHYLLRLEVLD